MRYRFIFLAVTAFFVAMNVLLWRSEFAAKTRPGSPVPAEIVWEKLLTSPDDSWLEIRHRGVKVGRAHWVARINEEFPEEADFDEEAPEGMIQTVTGYSLDFSGNVMVDESTRVRFDFGLTLDTNQAWQALSIKALVRPFSLTVNASAREQQVRLVTEGEARKELVYSFADLRNPDKLLRDLGGPLLPAALGALTLPLLQRGSGGDAAGAEGIVWEARHDRLQVGRNDVRVYRLEARLIGRYTLVLIVSPVGEVLRVELPDEIVMTNDALMNL